MTTLPVLRAHQLRNVPEDKKWLIKDLWSVEAVGIIGGEPKSCKSFLALSIAVAVTSGKPCLQHFQVNQTGRVLLYAAEDASHIVRDRLDRICAFQGIQLRDLDLWVITAPAIHLDVKSKRLELLETVEKLKPSLLILDPFVRLHTGIDENLSAAVAPILSSLRSIQKRFHCAVIIVHHARKGAAHIRGGQALRGSSEFHAWGDSNLFLRRKNDQLLLDIEHRSQKGQNAIPLMLDVKEHSLALIPSSDIQDNHTALSKKQDYTDRVLQSLRASKSPLRIRQIRDQCHIRTATLSEILKALVNSNKILKTKHGWAIQEHLTNSSADSKPTPVSLSPSLSNRAVTETGNTTLNNPSTDSNQLLFPFPLL
jgi:hypothetical protein